MIAVWSRVRCLQTACWLFVDCLLVDWLLVCCVVFDADCLLTCLWIIHCLLNVCLLVACCWLLVGWLLAACWLIVDCFWLVLTNCGLLFDCLLIACLLLVGCFILIYFAFNCFLTAFGCFDCVLVACWVLVGRGLVAFVFVESVRLRLTGFWLLAVCLWQRLIAFLSRLFLSAFVCFRRFLFCLIANCLLIACWLRADFLRIYFWFLVDCCRLLVIAIDWFRLFFLLLLAIDRVVLLVDCLLVA